MEMNETLILKTNLTFLSVNNIKKAILKYLIYKVYTVTSNLDPNFPLILCLSQRGLEI